MGQARAVEVLIDAGATLDLQNAVVPPLFSFITHRVSSSQSAITPLHSACSGGHVEIILKLLVAGVNVNSQINVRDCPTNSFSSPSSLLIN
jgi:ankyrin repeat protein